MKPRTLWMGMAFAASSALSVAGAGWLGQEPEHEPAQQPELLTDAVEEVQGAKGPGLAFGPGQKWMSIPVRLEVTRDYLEFLLVNPHGGVHESLLSTEVPAQVLNTALIAMGMEPGENVRWESLTEDPIDPGSVGVQGPAARDAPKAARDRYKVIPPQGSSLYLHVAWREGDETFFFRLEDLIRDLDRGRTLRRHPFVYLGSFMTERIDNKSQEFAATIEGNLINAAFFRKGATLLTTAVEECDKQSNWLANPWLLPERGSALLMLFAKEPLTELPESLRQQLPVLAPQQPEPDGDGPR